MAPVAPLFFPPAPPVGFQGFPITHYSIMYDIFTRANQDDAPNGWNSCRGMCLAHQYILQPVNLSLQGCIYRRLKRALTNAGFVRHQYSDWVRANTTSAHCWLVMFSLENIQPPHKLSSTVRGLRMSRIDLFATMDITDSIKIGGAHNTQLRGPVPAGLVAPAIAAGQMNPIPVPPVPALFVRPVDSRPGGADNPANFLV